MMLHLSGYPQWSPVSDLHERSNSTLTIVHDSRLTDGRCLFFRIDRAVMIITIQETMIYVKGERDHNIPKDMKKEATIVSVLIAGS